MLTRCLGARTRRGSLAAVGVVPLLVIALLVSACAANASAGTRHKGKKGHPKSTYHPLLGVDLLAPSVQLAPNIATRDEQILKAVRKQLWVNSVSINFYLFEKGDRTGTVRTGAFSTTPHALLALGREARALHMSVVLRPLIQVTPCTYPPPPLLPSCGWEGYIKPVHPKRWFHSLYSTELPYLKVAKQLHAKAFIVSSELLGLNRAGKYWKKLFAADHKIAKNMVLESATSTVSYFPKRNGRPILVPSDSYTHYGLDWYPVSGRLPSSRGVPHLSLKKLGPGTSISRLTQLMEKLLHTARPHGILRDTTISETGMPAAATAYVEPSKWNVLIKEATDPQVQAKWISAVCRTVQALHMGGAYFYDVNLDDNPLAWPTTNVGFMGKSLSMRAIRACASRFGLKRP